MKCQTSKNKTEHIGPVSQRSWYLETRSEEFLKKFKDRRCLRTKKWSRELSFVDVSSIVEAVDEIRKKYYLDEKDTLKDSVNNSGKLMTLFQKKTKK